MKICAIVEDFVILHSSKASCQKTRLSCGILLNQISAEACRTREANLTLHKIVSSLCLFDPLSNLEFSLHFVNELNLL